MRFSSQSFEIASRSGMDEGQAWLLNCLNATLDANVEIRTTAEDALMKASVQQGFGAALAKVTINKDLPLGSRQLAAVLLKQYVRQHWQEGEKYYTPPTASLEDKALIRSLILQALDDSQGKVRTAVGMAIASIANCDWPEEWPDLMDVLLSYIRDQNDINKVNGALRCLALFSGDLDDAHLPALVPVLFPSLYTIVSSPIAYGPSLQRRALVILHSCISTLGVMSGVYQAETKALMSPMLKAWMDQFSLILSPPVPAENPDDWGVRMEALKALMQIVQNFPKLAYAEFPVVLAPLWQTFVSCLRVYEQASVKGIEDSYSGLADSDGSDQSLEAFTIQLFEFLMTVVGQPRFSKVVEKQINDLVYFTVGYMQMTEEQVQTWSSDPNQYVADEDDVTYSCRVSGILLLEELVVTYELDGLRSIVQSVQRRIGEASQAKAAGQADWWKLREAAVLALGSVSEQLIEAQADGRIGLEGFLENILMEDLGSGVECPFLHGRALWAVAKFSSLISERRCEQFLHVAIGGLAANIPAPIKVGACRALSELFPRSTVQVLRPQMENVFTSLGSLLQEASDETLHLVLETLQAAVKADAQASAEMEYKVSPLVLNVWARHVSDPFISIDALEVLEALKDVPGCLEPLISRVLPFLGPILANPQHQATGLVAGALDLLTILLKNSPKEVVRIAHDVTFYSVISITLQSDDHSELQNATECLAVFVQGGAEALLTWGGDGSRTMRMLLDAAARLLNPDLDSSSSLFVERYITQLIQKLPTQMAQHVRDLVAALVGRMETAQIIGLKNSLVLVFARLVHLSSPSVGQLIDLLVTVPAKNFDNALAYVMSEWTKQQGEIQGAYQIKVSTTALALLLASKHQDLGKIYVQGRLMKSATSGIVTRSRAKETPDQWSIMPLAAKLLSLLADVLVEIQEQSTIGLDEDESWEEVGFEDDDNDDEEGMRQSISTKPNGKSVFQPLETMKHLLTEEVQEGDYKEDPCAASDPINKIDLSSYLVDFIQRFAAEDRPLFDLLCQELSEGEKIVVQAALAR